jgi:hypothetical protein
MFDPSTINAVGQIVGLAFDKNSGACCHGFLALPNSSEVPGSDTSPAVEIHRPNVVLPENIRKMLQQRLGSRYRIPGLGASRPE